MQPILQPRVLNLQELEYRTASMKVKGFSPTVGTKTWTNKLNPRFYYPLVLMEFSNALPGWFPLGQTRQILPASFSTLGKLVPAAESAWKLFSSLLDQVW